MMGSAPLVLRTSLAAPVRIGILASVALFAICVWWMAVTMISGAIIAPGQAVVRGQPKVVQSLDGGVVAEILAKDGDVVVAGQPLLRLDPSLLEIRLEIYRNRLAEIVAREARLEAEYVGATEVTFPAATPHLGDIALERHEAGQREIFIARAEVLAGRKEQLAERIAQFGNQISGVEGRIAATEDQLAYFETELEGVRVLNEQGLTRGSQLLELQRSQAELLGRLSEAQAELARIRNSIRDTELEILQADRQFKEEVVTELRQVTAEREELTLEIVSLDKQLERIEILSPAAGVVHEMQVTTVGGVVSPEATILEIVPTSAGVDYELRVEPRSIDQVFVGQRARVVFPAFDMRTAPEIFGTVSTISPTTIEDPVMQQSFFRVGLTLPPDQIALLGNVEMIPGMPVEAFLQTGDRSVFDYLVKPLDDQIRRAFRE
jgi:HlyD family secretion protein